MAKWTAADIPDQTGRTIVVTGANSGLGAVTATELARAGAHVVVACRDTAKGERAAAGMPGSAEVRRLDLADLASVGEFAAGTGQIAVLVNNAGVMATPLRRTRDGFELQVGTNHLGHFALTGLLLDRISDRVVTVSSSAHRLGRIRLDDLNWEHRRYNVGWPTARPNRPTCCSPTKQRQHQRHPRRHQPLPRGERQHRRQDPHRLARRPRQEADGHHQPPPRPECPDGRAAHAVRCHRRGPARRLLHRP
jgi:NAD(P)-dependent dehydrogenase (short-subunit alcohol dehydrogenase family)